MKDATISVSSVTVIASDAYSTTYVDTLVACPRVACTTTANSSEKTTTSAPKESISEKEKGQPKVTKIPPEKGWDNTFTAGCYSDKKFVDKKFEIRSSLKGIYFVETRKELLPNDTIQLLLANISERNIHIISNSLKKFASDLVSKHLLDHLRHVSYDHKWLSEQNDSILDSANVTGKSDKTDPIIKAKKNSNQSDVDMGNVRQNNDKLIPSEYVSHIDLLVTIIVSMITRNSTGPCAGKRERQDSREKNNRE